MSRRILGVLVWLAALAHARADEPVLSPRLLALERSLEGGDRDALPYVAVGLASRNPEERRLAAAVAAQLGDASQAVALARMAREEPDRRTRLTAAAALLSVSGGS